jgi:hypothetical protein
MDGACFRERGKIIKNWSLFPNDEAVFKLLYLPWRR